MRMRHAALLLAAACLLAADKEPDPRLQVKSLWTEAATASDLWTCLQLEAWAREQHPTPRLPSVLGNSVLVGSPLLAFPEPVHQLADCGDRVVVCTSRRLYTLAPDGRPLRTSVPLQPASESPVFGFAGAVVACVLAERDRKVQAQTLTVGTMLCDSGIPVLQTRFALDGEQRWTEDTAVADDGSAVALCVHDGSLDGPRSRSVLVCTAAGKSAVVPEMRSVVAVGRKGAWLVGNLAGRTTLLRGQDRQQIGQPAPGPGMLGALRAGRPMLVLADGTDKALDPGLPLGKEPAMATVGGWLVLATGYGAKGASPGDLLGEGAGAEVELPSTLVLWRWSDLVVDPAAKPAATMPGNLSVASDHPAGLLVWDGTKLDLVDLTGPQPRRSRRFDAPFPIAWAWIDECAVILTRDDGTRCIFGPDKAELWEGKAEDLSLRRPDLALYWTPGKAEGERLWHLQHLSADPKQRKTVDLELDPVDQDIEVGYRIHHYAVGRHGGEWRRVGFDGKLIDQGSRAGLDPKPRPPTDGWWGPVGRWYIDGPRLLPKNPAAPVPADRRLVLQDAWRFGSVGVLLDDQSRVQAFRRRGEPTEVGSQAGADRFGLANRQAALLASDGHAVAMIGSGPALIPRVADGAKAEEMPAGPWRLDDSGRFTIPRGRQQIWDGERVGFYPRRLRSPDDSGLFVITAPLLIELDPEAARLVGREP